MTFSCRYFADGSQYGQKDFSKFMFDAFDDGYVTGVGNELKCSCDGSNMTVSIATGRGYIQGYSFDITDSPESLPIPTADTTYDRIDRIVARLSPDANKNITLAVLQGTASATPQPTALTRTDATWEISLAKVLVPHGSSFIPSGNVTDERNDWSVCGVATFIRDKIQPQRLPAASSSALGAIKVGYGLNISADGTLNTTSSDLYGHFADTVPADKVAIKLSPGFEITPSVITDTSEQRLGYWNYNITYKYECPRINPKVSGVSITNAKITLTCKRNGYNATSADNIKVKHNGVTIVSIESESWGSSFVINLPATTVSEFTTGTWTLTGHADFRDTEFGTVTHTEDYCTSKIEYFVLE